MPDPPPVTTAMCCSSSPVIFLPPLHPAFLVIRPFKRCVAPPKPFDRRETPCHVFTYWGTADLPRRRLFGLQEAHAAPTLCHHDAGVSEGAERKGSRRACP